MANEKMQGTVLARKGSRTWEITNTVSVLLVYRLSPLAVLPTRASRGAAGYDLSSSGHYVVKARSRELVKTGLCMAVPEGTYGRIAPRSGLTWKNGLDVGAGVIDSDYRGEVGVILFNHSDQDFKIAPGDRIAQLVVERILLPEIQEASTDALLGGTQRAANGFGSSGITAVTAPQQQQQQQQLGSEATVLKSPTNKSK